MCYHLPVWPSTDGCSLMPFSVFLFLFFSAWGFLLPYPQAERLFTQPCPIYYWDQQRHSSFPIAVFLIWSTSFWFLSEFTSSLTLAIYFLMFYLFFSIEVFSILIIVFKIPSLIDLNSYSIWLWIWSLFSLFKLLFFAFTKKACLLCWKTDMIYWVKGIAAQACSNIKVGDRCLMIRWPCCPWIVNFTSASQSPPTHLILYRMVGELILPSLR